MTVQKSYKFKDDIYEFINGFSKDEEYKEIDKIEYLVNFLRRSYNSSLSKTKDLFSWEEGNLLLTIFNGFLLSDSNIAMAQATLMLECSDGIRLFNFDKVYRVNKEEILKKIESLDNFDAAVILNELVNYWHGTKEEKDSSSLSFIREEGK